MSMDFTPPPRRHTGESIVPMINVVFLLLIFFLMTSRLAPPEPFTVSPPKAENQTPSDSAPVLYLAETGEIGFRDIRGDAAIAAFAALAHDTAPQLRADANSDADMVARLLKQLAAAGLSDIALVVTPQ